MLDYISWFFRSYLPHTIFFLVFALAAAPILYYYRRRHADPRFRPTGGEMVLVSVFALILCAGAAAGLGTVFNKEHQFTKLGKEAPEEFSFGHESRAGSKRGKGEGGNKASEEDQAFSDQLLRSQLHK